MGDDDFQKFMDENNEIDQNASFFISALDIKTRFISELLNSLLSNYQCMTKEDSLKNSLEAPIKDLIKKSIASINQLDYAILNLETKKEEDTEDDEEESDPF